MKSTIRTVALSLSLLLLIFVTANSVLAADTIKVRSFSSVDAMGEYYQEIDYSTRDIVEGNYVILNEFPDDFDQINRVSRRKKLFHRVVLPLIYLENQRIRRERELLKNHMGMGSGLKSRRAGTKYTGVDATIREILLRYDLDVDPENLSSDSDAADTILRRVHPIPPSLVLAQAATESGWGTSRFCLVANNLFGERTYEEDVPGLKPDGVGKSADFRVRKFPTLLESVRSYMNTLNTHWAYEKFRVMRHDADSFDGLKMVQGLKKYSERRSGYVKSIRSLIKYNDYSRFDGVFP